MTDLTTAMDTRGVEASGQSGPTGNAAVFRRQVRPWHPSKRAQQLIGAMWDAVAAGDKWVYVTNANTARLTGDSLVWNGAAERDLDNPRRFRLPTEVLAANGYPTRDWQQYRDDMAELDEEDEAVAA